MTNNKKPLLHEILAIEQESKGKAERERARAQEVFRSKQNHFTGLRRTFRPFAVEEDGEDTGERLEAETKLAATVPQELEKMLTVVGKAIDLGFQIDEANTRARGDITIDGQALATDIPATFLLQLERRLREIRGAFREAPCFDPVRVWEPDASAASQHVRRAEPVVTIRKQRARKYQVMYEATKEHPAQVDIVEIDEPVGEIRSHEWTGMVSNGEKALLLERVDALIAAVKQARSRANTVAVDRNRKIGETLSEFLLAPLRR